MKKITVYIYILLISLVACNKDETMVTISSDAKPAKITSPSGGLIIKVTPDNLKDTLSITWDEADYGIATEVIYTLEADSKCGDFSKPVLLGSAKSIGELSLVISDLNSKLLDNLKTASHQKADIQLRVISALNNKNLTISDPVSISVTPFSDKPLALWVGENSTVAPIVYRTTGSAYEGYRYLTKGGIRFTNNPVCADSVYGNSGEPDKLAMGTSSALIDVPVNGFYKINIDKENLTYSLVLIKTWGMIGSSTKDVEDDADNGWNKSIPLTYNETTNVWSASIPLLTGALKFRANDGWDINYGPASSSDLVGTLVSTDAAINIPDETTYAVTIDFSQSTAPYTYKYSVVKKDFTTTFLWVPGGYQGYDPSKAPMLYSITDVTYEGYVDISSLTGIKFTTAGDYNHTNYGAGANDGELSTSGPDIDIPTVGYYKFNVNVDKLTYTKVLISSFGLVGPATLGGSGDGWNASVPMTYNATTKLWSKTMDLAVGALKFRANNDWPINYGPADSNSLTGILKFNDPGAIDIKVAGNYTVTLNFVKTDPDYQYTYTVKKN